MKNRLEKDNKFQKIKWNLHHYKYQKLLMWGLKHGYITPYNDALIKKLRTIYYGGIPASILLLSDGLSNGYCYDRALLMAQAFLDEDVNVELLYATVDSLRLNPKYIFDSNPLTSEHCIVAITDKNGRQYIIDTSLGFIFDKNLYWLIENPKIRKINDKNAIIKFVTSEAYYNPNDMAKDKYILPLILPMIEMTLNRPNEMYAELEILPREIAYFKKVINYDEICQEIKDDKKRLELKK